MPRASRQPDVNSVLILKLLRFRTMGVGSYKGLRVMEVFTTESTGTKAKICSRNLVFVTYPKPLVTTPYSASPRSLGLRGCLAGQGSTAALPPLPTAGARV